MIQEAIHKVINNEDLTYDEAVGAMSEIMSGEASQIQMATYLTALRMKGETIAEITASAQGMRNAGEHLEVGEGILEIVGTGGDEVGTFNISTTSSFVVACAGYPIAKHGNRSVSSKSGAADVLEELGVNLDISFEDNKKVFEETNMVFLFAQRYHSSMKNVGPVRKEMKERTVFNILGPLTNPAGADMQLLGVYSPDLIDKLAEVLANLGVKRGFAVCGGDGIDEITLTGPTHCCRIAKNDREIFDITPEQFGFKTCELSELIGGTPAENAEITRQILKGELKGPKRDVVAMNAGVGIYICKDNASLEECVKIAEEIIDSGKAYEKLTQFVDATNKYK